MAIVPSPLCVCADHCGAKAYQSPPQRWPNNLGHCLDVACLRCRSRGVISHSDEPDVPWSGIVIPNMRLQANGSLRPVPMVEKHARTNRRRTHANRRTPPR